MDKKPNSNMLKPCRFKIWTCKTICKNCIWITTCNVCIIDYKECNNRVKKDHKQSIEGTSCVQQQFTTSLIISKGEHKRCLQVKIIRDNLRMGELYNELWFEWKKSPLQTWTIMKIFYRRPKSGPTTIYSKIDCK